MLTSFFYEGRFFCHKECPHCEIYSYLSASIGDMFAALFAG